MTKIMLTIAFIIYIANLWYEFTDDFLFRLMVCLTLLTIGLILEDIKDGGK